MKSKLTFLALFLSLVTGLTMIWMRGTVSAGTISAPVLKWQHGGCYSSWCERGWYASPAVADLDNDGSPEVIASPYSLFALNGEDGSVQWQAGNTANRTWPGVVVADIDDNGDLEIVLAQGGGYLTVYNHLGNQVWRRQPKENELRGLSVYDLDNDGSMEIIVTATGNGVNTWVYEHNGTVRPGWPQMTDDSGYAWGVYNDNAAIGDLDGDGVGEIVVPSDVHYINAYEANASQIPAHSMYGNKGWGQVGIWESLATELRGWGRCDGVRAESFRTNYAHSPAVIADVNGDGVVEVVATGNVYDCHAGYPPSQYTGIYIFNADRSRFNEDGFNWESVPVDTGAPLYEDYSIIESVMDNPVVADLDGNGEMEILFASYDGRLHAFWLDKTEHHNWPFNVSATGPGPRFATEPAVVDIDGDGLAEVILASWPRKGQDYVGKLHILDYRGNILHEVDLPDPYSSSRDWNGALAAPTVDNIDADDDLEIVLNTANSGFMAYDLPNSENGIVLWGTGRGNYQRTGSFLTGSLVGSSMNASAHTPEAGDLVTYTIRLLNNGPDLTGVSLVNPLPVNVTYMGPLNASSGSASHNAGTINWSGNVRKGEPVNITYAVMVNNDVTTPTVILNSATVDDGNDNLIQLSAIIVPNGFSGYLPILVNE